MIDEGPFERPEISELEDRLVELRRARRDAEDLDEHRQIQMRIDGLRRRLAARKELVDTWEGDER